MPLTELPDLASVSTYFEGHSSFDSSMIIFKRLVVINSFYTKVLTEWNRATECSVEGFTRNELKKLDQESRTSDF